MDRLEWCSRKRGGLELVEPSTNLRSAHLRKAEDALGVVVSADSRDWKLTAAYYAIYHGLYSLLMEVGVKTEIHACTIEFAKKFLTQYFCAQDFDLIDRSFRARIDAQYYVDRDVSVDEYNFIVNMCPRFIVKCKNAMINADVKDSIRKKYSSCYPNESL